MYVRCSYSIFVHSLFNVSICEADGGMECEEVERHLRPSSIRSGLAGGAGWLATATAHRMNEFLACS